MTLPKNFTRRVDRSHRSYLRRLKRVEQAAQASRNPRRYMREFLSAPEVHFSAASKALGHLSDQTREGVLSLAQELHPWNQRSHRVEYFLKRKPNGDYRPICDLPQYLAAQHKLISHAIRAQMRPHPNLFGVAPPLSDEFRHTMPGNTGREGAIGAIQDLLRSGYSHVVEVDIRDCFQSFNPRALYDLPLPDEVIRRLLDLRNIEFLLQNTSQTSQPGNTLGHQQEQLLVQRDNIVGIPVGNTDGNPNGPRGLLQGSPVSSVILAFFLNQVLYELEIGDEAQCVVCFDNIVVASRTEAGLRRMTHALAVCLRQSCAGPFELSDPVAPDPCGFRYMGYMIDSDGSSIRIDPDRLSKLEARLSDQESGLDGPVNPVRSLKSIREFQAGFSAITDPNEELGYFVDNTLFGYDDRPSLLTDLGMALFAPQDTPERVHVNSLLKLYAS
ncbi:hypothetical protein [uncultured Tateyamaria sp.]|uniref:hypothetical protein n=1 Tax=uncultured Tateyamaria sp. TaxID=455651 RepID=UPI00260B1433|nr:hypothetical protein [uncultured Tateyamaria sp.]